MEDDSGEEKSVEATSERELPTRLSDVRRCKFKEKKPGRPKELVLDGGVRRCAVCHEDIDHNLLKPAGSPPVECPGPPCTDYWRCGWLARHPEASSQYPARVAAWEKREEEFQEAETQRVSEIKKAIQQHREEEKKIKDKAKEPVTKKAAMVVPTAQFSELISRAQSVFAAAPKASPSSLKSVKSSTQAAQQAALFSSLLFGDPEPTTPKQLTTTTENDTPTAPAKRSLSDLTEEELFVWVETIHLLSPHLDQIVKITKEQHVDPDRVMELLAKRLESTK